MTVYAMLHGARGQCQSCLVKKEGARWQKTKTNPTITSSIRDNRGRGTVGEFLEENIKPDAALSFVSAYFTIYAFEKLKKELESINNLNFLFGEPTFIKSRPW